MSYSLTSPELHEYAILTRQKYSLHNKIDQCPNKYRKIQKKCDPWGCSIEILPLNQERTIWDDYINDFVTQLNNDRSMHEQKFSLPALEPLHLEYKFNGNKLQSTQWNPCWKIPLVKESEPDPPIY